MLVEVGYLESNETKLTSREVTNSRTVPCGAEVADHEAKTVESTGLDKPVGDVARDAASIAA